MGLFTLCSFLKTKESYDRWITRRVWGFRHQISKEKNLKMSVTNIRKLQEKFRCKRAMKFRSKKDTISQPKADFAVVRNLPSTWSDWLPMAVTLSFQLQIVYLLKRWIDNFPSFKITYSMHKLHSRKCSKSG